MPSIAKDEMMTVLLDACPSFSQSWQAFLDEWRDEADDLPLYIALAQFARHLCDMLGRRDTATFPEIFQAIERLQVEGDEYVQTAACVGLLESLQNPSLHVGKGTEPEEFRPFLGRESGRFWFELNKFWTGGGARA